MIKWIKCMIIRRIMHQLHLSLDTIQTDIHNTLSKAINSPLNMITVKDIHKITSKKFYPQNTYFPIKSQLNDTWEKIEQNIFPIFKSPTVLQLINKIPAIRPTILNPTIIHLSTEQLLIIVTQLLLIIRKLVRTIIDRMEDMVSLKKTFIKYQFRIYIDRMLDDAKISLDRICSSICAPKREFVFILLFQECIGGIGKYHNPRVEARWTILHQHSQMNYSTFKGCVNLLCRF